VDGSLLLMQVINGLQLGLLLFMVASGLTLVFGILDFVNLAHASLYMVGAMICAWLSYLVGGFVVAVLLALPLTALVGWAIERWVARRLYARNHLDHVLATFGLILVLNTSAHLLWGPEGIPVALPDYLKGQLVLGDDLVLPKYRVIIIAAGLLAALGLFWLVTRTKLGMLIRAGASNRQMVAALGINIELLFTVVFSLGAVLAGLAGMLITPITEASLGMGNAIIITAFVVIIVGGIGSIKGSFVAALLIGMIDTLGRSFLDVALGWVFSANAAENSAPAISAMLIYIIMALVLAVKPQGLFPPKVR
jgi:branched-chain amino acid transport system permease protein